MHDFNFTILWYFYFSTTSEYLFPVCRQLGRTWCCLTRSAETEPEKLIWMWCKNARQPLVKPFKACWFGEKLKSILGKNRTNTGRQEICVQKVKQLECSWKLQETDPRADLFRPSELRLCVLFDRVNPVPRTPSQDPKGRSGTQVYR